jgi:hypothetical protein
MIDDIIKTSTRMKERTRDYNTPYDNPRSEVPLVSLFALLRIYYNSITFFQFPMGTRFVIPVRHSFR